MACYFTFFLIFFFQMMYVIFMEIAFCIKRFLQILLVAVEHIKISCVCAFCMLVLTSAIL